MERGALAQIRCVIRDRKVTKHRDVPAGCRFGLLRSAIYGLIAVEFVALRCALTSGNLARGVICLPRGTSSGNTEFLCTVFVVFSHGAQRTGGV